MTYELTIDSDMDKTFVAFLKRLNFVQIKKYRKMWYQKANQNQDDDLPYFGAALDWDINANELRNKNTKTHRAEW